jgi:chromosome partitioning protein
MDVIAIYSESGGVTKTTTAVSVATVLAKAGRRVVLVDLDPRGAASQWLQIEPKESGWHSGAILASDDAPAWVTDLPVSSSWSPNLSMIPSNRRLSTREEGGDSDADMRLRRGLAPLSEAGTEYVVLDMPNRQGGPITRAALNATDRMVYASTLSPDGISGVEGAQLSVSRFKGQPPGNRCCRADSGGGGDRRRVAIAQHRVPDRQGRHRAPGTAGTTATDRAAPNDRPGEPGDRHLVRRF